MQVYYTQAQSGRTHTYTSCMPTLTTSQNRATEWSHLQLTDLLEHSHGCSWGQVPNLDFLLFFIRCSLRAMSVEMQYMPTFSARKYQLSFVICFVSVEERKESVGTNANEHQYSTPIIYTFNMWSHPTRTACLTATEDLIWKWDEWLLVLI